MKTRHVILRAPKRTSGDHFLGASTLFQAADLEQELPKPSVSTDELSGKDIATLSRDSDVVAIAPAMPMKLIKPTGEASVTAQQAMSWGVSAVLADKSPFTGDGVVVAVLDTGIDSTHPAFNGVKINFQNFTPESDLDEIGHGTHCAGTIFGRDVNGTRIGVARGVKTALIGKVLGKKSGPSDQVARGIQWAADNGANVISMSLGIDFPGYVRQLMTGGLSTEPATSRALEGYRANVQLFERLAALIRAQAAFGRVTILVAAAGNESQRPSYEIAASPPAVSEGFVSVAALDQTAVGYAVAPFSNTGANLSGPGVNIISAKVGGGLTSMSGTSMATPHVAGVAALWAHKTLAQTKTLPLVQWSSRVIASCSTANFVAGFDSFAVGAGLVQAPLS